ncbi:MAG: amidase domain-containing protein [Anaerolineales bacterium]|nr:amidase domain-containing protein [Anaerolineales bacterium]
MDQSTENTGGDRKEPIVAVVVEVVEKWKNLHLSTFPQPSWPKDVSNYPLHDMYSLNSKPSCLKSLTHSEFEISREVSKTKPIISKMRNLQHSLILRKDNGTWKIVSDNYEDYLWRMMKFTGLSKEDLIRPVENSQNQLLGSDVTMSAYTTCNLPEDHSTYPYNRDGAVEYAHQYATSPNLSKYCYYPDPWGDC